MFGYVRIAKPEMKIADFERYQGVYCSLCRRLGKKYGFWVRMSLSYDFTFLALLGMATDAECVSFKKGRCPYNPLKKRLCCADTTYIDYASDAAMLLLYYKLEDTLRDDGFWKRFFAGFLHRRLRRAYRRAAALRPEWDARIGACMQKQVALEEASTASVDAAAEPTAQMLACLAKDVGEDTRERRVLERLGYLLGRFVYLIDAVDDMEEDLENETYNPYVLVRELSEKNAEAIAQAKAYAAQTLYATIAECRATYELLTVRRFDAILRNVLEQGMPLAVEQVLAKQVGRNKRRARSV